MPKTTIDNSALELLKMKAEQYDKLQQKMSEFYSEDESNDDTDLGTIGEYMAIHFGYL